MRTSNLMELTMFNTKHSVTRKEHKMLLEQKGNFSNLLHRFFSFSFFFFFFKCTLRWRSQMFSCNFGWLVMHKVTSQKSYYKNHCIKCHLKRFTHSFRQNNWICTHMVKGFTGKYFNIWYICTANVHTSLCGKPAAENIGIFWPLAMEFITSIAEIPVWIISSG